MKKLDSKNKYLHAGALQINKVITDLGWEREKIKKTFESLNIIRDSVDITLNYLQYGFEKTVEMFDLQGEDINSTH